MTTLTDLASGSIVAAYEYSAFGEILRESGTFASDNPFRFATHFTDKESGLVYYGLRYYSPGLGRFINRGPIAEAGGRNLYAFVGNNPINSWDYLGMGIGFFIGGLLTGSDAGGDTGCGGCCRA